MLVASLAGTGQQASETDFTVGDIKIEGLQRISEGTVFNYLPVNIGDQLTAQRLREALRALYATGFFRDVALSRDGNTLLITVLERPSLESVEIKGNKDIKTEDLQKSLRNGGPGGRQDLQPLDARGGHAIPDRPVLQPRQVRGARSTPRSRTCRTTACA